MPAVGRRRGIRRRQTPRIIPKLAVGRPRGGFHSVGGLPKTAEKIDPESGKRFYQKSSHVYYVNLKKDRRIRAKPGSRGTKEPHFRGDSSGSKI